MYIQTFAIIVLLICPTVFGKDLISDPFRPARAWRDSYEYWPNNTKLDPVDFRFLLAREIIPGRLPYSNFNGTRLAHLLLEDAQHIAEMVYRPGMCESLYPGIKPFYEVRAELCDAGQLKGADCIKCYTLYKVLRRSERYPTAKSYSFRLAVFSWFVGKCEPRKTRLSHRRLIHQAAMYYPQGAIMASNNAHFETMMRADCYETCTTNPMCLPEVPMEIIFGRDSSWTTKCLTTAFSIITWIVYTILLFVNWVIRVLIAAATISK